MALAHYAIRLENTLLNLRVIRRLGAGISRHPDFFHSTRVFQWLEWLRLRFPFRGQAVSRLDSEINLNMEGDFL